MEGGGFILKRSKVDVKNAELLVKTVFHLLLRISDLSSFKNYVERNERNMYNVFASMFNGSTRIDFSDKTITGVDEQYNKIAKSSGFYNVFPPKYSYFKKIVKQAENMNINSNDDMVKYIKSLNSVRNTNSRTKTNRFTSRLIKTPGKTKKKTSSKNNTSTQLSYNEFKKMTKGDQGKLIDKTNNEDTITLELSILYMYVYVALYIKQLFIIQLFELYKQNYEQTEDDKFTEYYKELIRFYTKYSDGKKYFSVKYIDEIKEIIMSLKPLFKKRYNCKISSSYIIKSIEEGKSIPVNKLRKVFVVNPFVPELLTNLIQELETFYDLKKLLISANNN